MIYRILLVLLGLFMVGYGIAGIKRGKIYAREYYYRDENAFKFWFAVASVFLLALVLFYFAVFGKPSG